MKNIKFLLVVFVFALISCEKDEEQNTDYVGTWVIDNLIVNGIFEGKEQLVLAKNDFTRTLEVETVGGAYVDLFGLKGTMTVDGEELELHPNRIGFANINQETFEIGEFIWYEETMPGFEEAIEPYGGFNIAGKWEVEDGILTIKLDVNGDGSYSTDEISTYEKL